MKERKMYSRKDIDAVVQYIEKNSLQKIYVVGATGSGKYSFSEKISELLDYNNIDLDLCSQRFARETGRTPKIQKEILEFALAKNQAPFVINHADLLNQGLLNKADLVIFLNPSKEELLISRRDREKSGAEGDWKNIDPEKYGLIIEENQRAFNNLKGKVVYKNPETGTIVKTIPSNLFLTK